MGRPIELVVGKIMDLEDDRCAGWQAFYKVDYELAKAIDEIADLKAEIRRLKRGRKIKG
jgi:hypothetical protein